MAARRPSKRKGLATAMAAQRRAFLQRLGRTSLSAAARACGLSRQTLYNWLRGASVSTATLTKIEEWIHHQKGSTS